MSRLARVRQQKVQAEVLGVASLTGASVIGMKISKPTAGAANSAASGSGTVIAMVPQHLAESSDVFLVRFDSGADVEMTADEVQQFCVSRGEATQESDITFTAAVAEGELLAIAPPDDTVAKFWLCWADAPLAPGAKDARVPVTWLERHTESGEPRQYEEGAADDVRGPRSGGVARASILGRVRAAGPVDRAEIVELSAQEAKNLLCIVGGKDVKPGFLSREDALPKEIASQKVAELRTALGKRKLSTQGKKEVLAKRLRDSMIAEFGG